MSPAKLEANRQNATLSTGPSTPQGKAASARNATTHGLTARQSILVGETPEEYQAFVNDYLDYYRPTNNVDRALVLELGDLRWRLRRVPVVETQAWNHEMLELAKLPENAKYSSNEIMAMAFVRLIQNKVITNLYAQEGRLQGRANRIQKRLEAVEHLRTMTPKPCPIPQHILERTEALPADECPAESAQPQSAEALPEICKNEPIRVAPKPGRNEPCPCGSGVKYKRCCLNLPQTSEKALSAAA